MCGNKSFVLSEGYFVNTIQPDMAGCIRLEGPSIPTIAIICKQCGFVSQHSAMLLGLIDRNVSEANRDKSKTLAKRGAALPPHREWWGLRAVKAMNKEETKEYQRVYYQNNKDKIKEGRHRYYEKNKDEIKKKQIKYSQKNKEKISAQRREYYLKNKESLTEYSAEYRQKNKEYSAEYRQKNKEMLKEYYREYYLKNKEKIKERAQLRAEADLG